MVCVCVCVAVLSFQLRQESETLHWLTVAMRDVALTGYSQSKNNKRF